MMETWVKQIVEESGFSGQKLSIGKIVRRPNGDMVKITKGQFWGEYGVSNFWYWRKVLKNGEFGKEEHGYGWDP